MKTKNFPERKRQRRIRALERLQAAISRLERIDRKGYEGIIAKSRREAETLERRIPHDSQRTKFTKKRRAGKAR